MTATQKVQATHKANGDDTFVAKLGKTRAGDRTRVWLEGNRLADAGFKHGKRYLKVWDEKSRTLTLSLFAPGNDGAVVSGKPDRPVIDITGQRVAATFRTTHVAVTYAKGTIKIGEAK